MREAMRLGCDVIGGIPHYEWTREDGVEEVHFLFDLARETGAPIDLHCDETDDEQSRFLEVVAARTMRDGMQGRVVAGHTTAMGSYNDAYAFKLLQILKRAGVTIVANPLDNIVLQGRFDTYPKRRGMTRVKELDAAGVNVACGHDSIMDPWYPLGRGSMLDALSMLVHVAQMTGRTELFRAYEMVTTNPARAAEVAVGRRRRACRRTSSSSIAPTRPRRSASARRRAGSSAMAGSSPRPSRPGASSTSTGVAQPVTFRRDPAERGGASTPPQHGRRGADPRAERGRSGRMTAGLLTGQGMPTREGDLSIEGHGMDPIPESARYGSVGAGLHGLVHAEPRARRRSSSGRSPRPSFIGLGFWTALAAIVVGNLVGSVLVGAAGDDGPEDRHGPDAAGPARLRQEHRRPGPAQLGQLHRLGRDQLGVRRGRDLDPDRAAVRRLADHHRRLPGPASGSSATRRSTRSRSTWRSSSARCSSS